MNTRWMRGRAAAASGMNAAALALAMLAPVHALAQFETTTTLPPTTTSTIPTPTTLPPTTSTTFIITTTTSTTSTTFFTPECEVPEGANLVVTDLTDGLTPNDLAAALVGAGVTVSNVTLTGAPIAAGRFADSAAATGIPTGVILSSGCAKSAAGPNDEDGYTVHLNEPGDADLSGLIGGAPTNDATVLEFDFVPDTDTIQVRYVFSSEEYNEYVNSSYNDVFGFFVNGVNKALLPDGVTVVSINNVNGGNPFGSNASNPAFFRNNDPNDPAATLDIEPDGLTVELVLTAVVNPQVTNHFKIAIADTGDRSLDSWIFLQTGSFTSVENCTNQRDDDGDDLVDANDPDCWICGNGRTDPGEGCDDGGIEPGDGCDPFCAVEAPQLCGNEEIDKGETCDDGNTSSGDGCDDHCQIEVPPSTCSNGCVEQGEECDDGNTATGDGCDAGCDVEQCYTCGVQSVTTTTIGATSAPEFPQCTGPSVCAPSVGASCDDGDLCTVGDSCGNGGTCGGDAVIIPAACRWVMVGGDPTRRVRARTRGQTEVAGDICGEETIIGETSTTTGDVVGMFATGNAVRIGPAAAISGDVVTAGGAVKGKPSGSILPDVAVDEIAGGATVAKGAGVYDTTGSHAQVAACNDAQADIDTAAALLDALPSTTDLGNVHISGGSSLTLAPGTTPGVVAGGLNVIDIERFTSGNEADLILDGGGNADTVYVVRVAKKFDLHFRGGLLLANGQQASKVIVYGKNKCKFGEEVTGSGTVICPEGKLLMEERTTWTGALLGGKQIVQLRDSGNLTHVPLQVGP
ncbi:MAG TPA: choice-of-anchor L domain-containing protein [Candidatus Limnocylindrales bacterium]|nr:choice-of-anchor L domain-containing protein [Candidatus Limnocylindrales bacterium]